MKKQNIFPVLLVLLFFCATVQNSAQSRKSIIIINVKHSKSFVHPGILHSQASLDHIFEVASKKTMPEYGSYELLKNHPCASPQYKMNGPFKIISRDGQYAYTKSKMEADFSAAYLNALMWIATKDESHAKKSLEILGAYADSLKFIPSTNDAPLLVGLEGLKIINAMEILRYTYNGMTPDQLGKINKMITCIFLPVCETFYKTKAYTNGNWGSIVTKTYISAAIYFDNKAMYNKAIDFYYNANDNGTIQNYISGTTGQIQESGRDQGHSQLGIGAMATVCEIAYNQGDDLYSALNNRLLKGFEYVVRYNLGDDNVPFTTWKDITGKYSDWTVISDKSRGHFIPIYEMVYNHYVNIKGLSMPYTEKVIKKNRPEGYDRDQPAFGTLLFYGTGK
ncbi:MAG: alginate lyase family protein [Paludibacter sp.]|nr:alginate lyase family protein [Paludibacter sp.]